MRIVTWNCYRGDCLTRAAELLPWRPDVVLLQECARPKDGADGQCLWFGDNPRQGVGVVARNGFTLYLGPLDPRISHSVFPVVVSGPTTFHLLAVWSQLKPTYLQAIDAGLTAYRQFLSDAPSVVAGDFNSHWRWDKPKRKLTHASLVSRLREEFGLVSAYHCQAGDAAEEPPTCFWQWNEQQPFHIDYCFLPQAWTGHIREVKIGNFAPWKDQSDHRPLLVEVNQ